MDIIPKQTLYIKNLFEKIGASELKKCLYCIFSQFGKIAFIQCVKTNKLRGQAWIVFADLNSATNALRTMQGFPFFEKHMEIQYAADESIILQKATGTWQPKKKKQKVDTTAKTAPKAAEAGGAAAGDAGSVPNKLLFVEGLPEGAKPDMLQLLFGQYPGFVEVRMPDNRPGIAFVEYDNDSSASASINGLQGFAVAAGHNLKIAYAK